ncbi:MAG: Hsp70 family protein, partial [Eubacteriales bacterium]|nr:Hsp70 family protein [Eubacteriales bacterium]
HVLQGEREMAAYNTSLGRFILDGITPAPRGIPQIEVTFDIDANGIVKVSAKDKGTGKEQHITIQSSGNMSKNDIEKAVRDAEMHAGEDKKQRETIEVKNNAENAVYRAEKMLTDLGDKVTETDKAPVNEAVAKLRETVKSGDTDAIKADTEALEKSFYAISEKLYGNQGGANMGNSGNPGNPGDGMGGDAGNSGGDGVYDADFTDKT